MSDDRDRKVLEGQRWIVGRVVVGATPDQVVKLIADGSAAIVNGELVAGEYECRSQEDALIVAQRMQAERGGVWVSVAVVDPADLAPRPGRT